MHAALPRSEEEAGRGGGGGGAFKGAGDCAGTFREQSGGGVMLPLDPVFVGGLHSRPPA